MIPLLPHQQEGVTFLHNNGGKGLLYLDAGTGKSFTALAYTAQHPTPPYHVLILCPASLKQQWVDEACKYFGTDNVVIRQADDSPCIWFQHDDTIYCVTNYETLLSDLWYKQIRALSWSTIIADESHMLNNPAAKRTKRMKAIPAGERIALSGTPMPNALHDIWSIADWLQPGILGKSFWWFKQQACIIHPTYHGIIGYREGMEDKIRATVAPLIYRIHREDVLHDLPAKEEEYLWVDLGASHRAMYKELQRTLMLEIADMPKLTVTNAISLIARLRQLTDLPQHFAPDEPQGSKLDMLDMLLRDTQPTLVFSEFATVIDAVAARYPQAAVITGSTSLLKRHAAVRSFMEGETNILLSTAAGGVGLNLQRATRVIHLGLPWNASRLEQRVSRAWRHGTTHTVHEIYILAHDTIDQKMLRLIEKKKDLAQKFNKDELLSLIV